MWQRAFRLFAISAIGGMLLGASAAYHYDEALIGAIIGTVVGMACSPVVIVCLWKKRLILAVPAAFGIPWIVAVASGFAEDPLLPLAASVAALCVCCGSSALLLPNGWSRYPKDCCQYCGYLINSTAKRCSECGRALKIVDQDQVVLPSDGDAP